MPAVLMAGRAGWVFGRHLIALYALQERPGRPDPAFAQYLYVPYTQKASHNCPGFYEPMFG